MSDVAIPRAPSINWRLSLFAAMLASAGLPLYIHLPRYATTELGLGLATVGAILIGIRIIDFVQDPLLGKMVDRWSDARGSFAAVAIGGLALGFIMLFAMKPAMGAVPWLVGSLIILFTSYSLATILMYGQGVAMAEQMGGDHYKVAAYRESGLLAGVVVAAFVPGLLIWFGRESTAYRDFGILLAATALIAGLLTRPLWSTSRVAQPDLSLAALKDAGGFGMLLLALVNALPVALTSTLFLFFVEDRLGLPALSGLFLVLFFASAGISAPLWSLAAQRFGTRPVLVLAMGLAIVAFAGAASLPAGAAFGFSTICLASGVALGADVVILPALFSAALAREGLPAGLAFGLWSFATKLSLAVAAALALPFLQLWDFTPGGVNGPGALSALAFAYAILPCLIKVGAIAMVLRLPEKTVRP